MNEVHLEALLADATVGALQPGPEVADDPMDPREDLVRLFAEQSMRAWAAGLVVQAELAESLVTLPVGVDGRPGGGAFGHEVAERVGGGVVDELHADPPGARAAGFDGHDQQGLDPMLATTSEPSFVSADEALVDLDLAGERLPLGIWHRAPQLVKRRPRRFVALQPELALQLERRDPRRCSGDQVGGPEPQMQRCTRSVKHRARGHRHLVPTSRALPQQQFDSAVATAPPHRGQWKPAGHLGSNRYFRQASSSGSGAGAR